MHKTLRSRAASSSWAVTLRIAVVVVLLICAAMSATAADEQVRFIVRRQGKDVSSQCTALVASEAAGMAGMFIGGPNGLYAKLPAGKYTAVIQHNVQQVDSLSLPASVDFEVTAGREVVVEVEIQPLMLDALMGAGSQLGFGGQDYGGWGGSGSSYGGSYYGDYDYDGYDYDDWSYDDYSIDSWNYGGLGSSYGYGGWGYGSMGYDSWDYDSWDYDDWDYDVNAAYGAAGSGARSATSGKAASKQPPVDPWMADANDCPDIRPYGPYDE